MALEFYLNVLSALFMFVGAIAPIFFTVRVNNPTLRTLSALLSAFLVLHGLYHLASLVNTELFEAISDGILEPLSWTVLVAFAVYYTKRVG